MNEEANEPERIPRPPKGCLAWVIGAGLVFLLLSLLIPDVAWTGADMLTIEVRVTDASTNRPITNATVTLRSAPPAHIDERIESPYVLATKTDARGHASLKYMFGAGGGRSNTTIVVRGSLVRCEAVGYVPAEVPVAQTGRLRFRNFPFVRRKHSLELPVALSPQ